MIRHPTSCHSSHRVALQYAPPSLNSNQHFCSITAAALSPAGFHSAFIFIFACCFYFCWLLYCSRRTVIYCSSIASYVSIAKDVFRWMSIAMELVSFSDTYCLPNPWVKHFVAVEFWACCSCERHTLYQCFIVLATIEAGIYSVHRLSRDLCAYIAIDIATATATASFSLSLFLCWE